MRLSSRHAGAAAIAFHAVRRAISAKVGAVLLGVAETAVAAAVLAEHLPAAIVRLVAAMLNPAAATDWPMISIVPIRGVRPRAFLGVPAAIGTEISIGVIAAVRSVVRIFTRLVIALGVERSVGAIPRMVSASRGSSGPAVVAVVVGVVPGVVVDVGGVVVDDRCRSSTAAAAPMEAPGVPSPAETTTPAASTEPGANRDRRSKINSD